MALRLSLLYAALFAIVGVTLPFWPLWLADRGLAPTEIAIVAGAAIWSKILVNPLAGSLADALGRRRAVMLGLAAASLALYGALALVQGFWPILILAVAASSLFTALMPLTETVTLAALRFGGLDYGRVRLWGSVSFIALAMGLGPVIAAFGAGVISWTIVALLGVVLAVLPGMPDPPEGRRGATGGARLGGGRLPRDGGMLGLLTNGRFVLFLISDGLIQAGHATYYALGSVHWHKAGLGETQVGLLWAEGVVAEVLLFAFGAPLVRLCGPFGLLGLAAAAGVARWSITAWTTDPAILALIQPLHGLTFAAAHLGSMHHITRSIPTDRAARAQALYSAVCAGMIMGAAMTLAGPAYAALGGRAFLVDALWCALGGLGIGLLALIARRDGATRRRA
ncbi:MFS transporter [Rhodospirillum rubrum]|uniref:Major facilitator superfamily MFS_1 n=1 Tax=Rhodospirillum rubrum (strain ATCC 11170 / ATH 1.1.1 / DSM 467 / LMG 4362 / NCIMB 8255 / S1) TaxID=269796 RepID=Q2RTT8_RHORT|nr:MFS transporter [Rhodospirillum rubrum]ABC22457.1 Major facilitator superfamily MFS_1 [Rhodospirillum rubrum ATCC 11170]AEO48174.1 major facilitator transporter [Rhodospirillum rubrum F11]MBK5954039.1 MFS transporter [Rhodospirillum rubrum]QXG82089.1 MFS transporter [Rhodospirillum rubrum]